MVLSLYIIALKGENNEEETYCVAVRHITACLRYNHAVNCRGSQKPVSLSKTSLTMKPGASKTLKMKKTSGVKIRSQKFTSTNKKVASVTTKGKVTAK